jgi:hypothetical protein
MSKRRRIPSVSPPPVWQACLAILLATPLAAPGARAVEVLSVHELASHCRRLEAEPRSADAQSCVRYIQGFIDGAVATDARVMLDLEAETDREESFTERAKRTRAPGRADRYQAARLAAFCLGDPLPLRDLVDRIVADLVQLDSGDKAESPSREAVYASLQNHYPCAGE